MVHFDVKPSHLCQQKGHLYQQEGHLRQHLFLMSLAQKIKSTTNVHFYIVTIEHSINGAISMQKSKLEQICWQPSLNCVRKETKSVRPPYIMYM